MARSHRDADFLGDLDLFCQICRVFEVQPRVRGTGDSGVHFAELPGAA